MRKPQPFVIRFQKTIGGSRAVIARLMPHSKWTDEDIAKIKSLAEKVPAKDIARELGRTPRIVSGPGFKAENRVTIQSIRIGRRRQRTPPLTRRAHQSRWTTRQLVDELFQLVLWYVPGGGSAGP